MPIAGLALRSGMLLNTAGRFENACFRLRGKQIHIARAAAGGDHAVDPERFARVAVVVAPDLLERVSQMVSEMIEVAVTVLRPISHDAPWIVFDHPRPADSGRVPTEIHQPYRAPGSRWLNRSSNRRTSGLPTLPFEA